MFFEIGTIWRKSKNCSAINKKKNTDTIHQRDLKK